MDSDGQRCRDESPKCTISVRLRTNRTFGEIVETGLRLSGLEPVSWTLADRDVSVLDIYATCEREGRALMVRVRALVSSWAEGERWTIALRRLPREDWAESWKRFFKVERVSKRITVRPPWRRVVERPGCVVVEIEPGMSFGTGQHPTTRSCLRLLDGLVGKNPGSLLDIGCGSGILAIAGVKLGFGPVLAVDNDPVAVRIAMENARRNGVGQGIDPSLARTIHMARRGPGFAKRLRRGTRPGPTFLERIPMDRASALVPPEFLDEGGSLVRREKEEGKSETGNQLTFRVADLAAMRSTSRYDVVVANILAGVLIEHAGRVVRFLRRGPQSRLILSGILTAQYALVKATYEASGLEEYRRICDGKWTSGCFRWAG